MRRYDPQPWWEVDVGSGQPGGVATVGTVRLWNRVPETLVPEVRYTFPCIISAHMGIASCRGVVTSPFASITHTCVSMLVFPEQVQVIQLRALQTIPASYKFRLTFNYRGRVLTTSDISVTAPAGYVDETTPQRKNLFSFNCVVIFLDV